MKELKLILHHLVIYICVQCCNIWLFWANVASYCFKLLLSRQNV